jgi:hypothetical protein
VGVVEFGQGRVDGFIADSSVDSRLRHMQLPISVQARRRRSAAEAARAANIAEATGTGVGGRSTGLNESAPLDCGGRGRRWCAVSCPVPGEVTKVWRSPC